MIATGSLTLQALAAPVAVADLGGQGRVLAAPVIGLAGGGPLAGLGVGGRFWALLAW